MVVVYPKTEEAIPLAIVDGYLPDEIILNHIIDNYREIKIGKELTESDRIRRYATICELVNEIELSLHGSSPVEHFMIFSDFNKDLTDNLGDKRFTELLKEPNYSVNIIVNTNNDNWARLRQYVFLWISITGFKIKRPVEYDNYPRYLKNANNLLEEIQNAYDTPIVCPIIEKIYGVDNYWFAH